MIKPMGIDDVPIVQPDAVDCRSGTRRLPARADRACGRDRGCSGAGRAHRPTIGGARRALRVLLDVEASARLRLTPQDVRMALIGANVAMPSAAW